MGGKGRDEHKCSKKGSRADLRHWRRKKKKKDTSEKNKRKINWLGKHKTQIKEIRNEDWRDKRQK